MSEDHLSHQHLFDWALGCHAIVGIACVESSIGIFASSEELRDDLSIDGAG